MSPTTTKWRRSTHTIAIMPETREALAALKLIPRETYDDVLKRLLIEHGRRAAGEDARKTAP